MTDLYLSTVCSVLTAGNKAHRTLSTSSLRPTISRSTTHTRSSSASSSRSHSSASSASSHHSHPHKHGPNSSHLVSKISRKSSGPQVSTKGRGETALVEIHDHFCRWNQSIVANVRMPIESASSSSKGKEKEGEGGEVVGRLGERELHLAVHQVRPVLLPANSERHRADVATICTVPLSRVSRSYPSPGTPDAQPGRVRWEGQGRSALSVGLGQDERNAQGARLPGFASSNKQLI